MPHSPDQEGTILTVTNDQLSLRVTTFRVAWLVLAGGWALVAALYAAFLRFIAGSFIDCPDPVDDSGTGTAQWSWEHLGNTCTYTDTSWLAPGESVTLYSDSAWLGVLGLAFVAVTLLALGLTGFRATRRVAIEAQTS